MALDAWPDDVPVVILDANVLFPFHTGHMLAFMATNRVIRAHWTREIEREWIESVLEKYGEQERKGVESRRDAMNRALPDALIQEDTSLIPTIFFPDLDDRHVIAAAMTCGASRIVTRDGKFFGKDRLSPYGVSAIDPDDLLYERLDEARELVVDVTEPRRVPRRPFRLSHAAIFCSSSMA